MINMLKVTVLIENSVIDDQLVKEHGLSLFIEITNGKGDLNILFDFGGSDRFLNNALYLGVDVNKADFGVLSHGHYDHGGGLEALLVRNNHAPIYVHEEAFLDYYSIMTPIEHIRNWNSDVNPVKYIGLNKSLKSKKSMIFVSDRFDISDNIILISNIKGHKFRPSGNKRLLTKKAKLFSHDSFIHEQNMIILDGDKCILFAGCAHNGITNIIDYVEAELELKVTHVVSGLHLYNKKSDLYESDDIVKEIGDYFMEKEIVVYTGHCTGKKAFHQLEKLMGQRINILYTGKKIII